MTISILYGLTMFVVTLCAELLVLAAARGIVRIMQDWRLASWTGALLVLVMLSGCTDDRHAFRDGPSSDTLTVVVIEADTSVYHIPRDTARRALSDIEAANIVRITRDSAGAYHVETTP